MASTVIVQPGQSLEDIALQEYGSIDGVREVVMDNEDVFVDGFNTRLLPGTTLVVRDVPLNRVVYSTMRKLRIVPATLGDNGPDPLGTQGDYNGDFNGDHFITT
ncbi:MAG: hypothetical protein JNJ91_05350 [Flavobacteriales bacterium]|nr:hypothetical protein [Flavobacteriales bacterium]